jgi:DUF218 domain
MPRRSPFLLAVLLLGALAARAAEPLRAPLPLRDPLQDKNFWLLSVLDQPLPQVLAAKREALHRAATACEKEAECFAAALRWTDGEMAEVAAALRPADALMRALRGSGAYVRYASKPDRELLAAAWLDAARGINNIIDVYATGKAPRYPAIDSVSYDVKSEAYLRLLHTVAASLDEQTFDRFFEPSLRFALQLLRINHRDEAARHEPMERKDNAAAVKRIATIAWKSYPYSAIVVPGAGSDRLTWSLSAASRLRAEIAARRFKERKAPLIIVSGGYVHPNQTPYSEAIEMKKVLVSELSVPAAAVIVDPHARHTTTNLRNAARLMYRYGLPFEAKALLTTDSSQSTYIEGKGFAERCEKELGYQPVAVGRRVSAFDLELTPRIQSLQIDAMDPLDP